MYVLDTTLMPCLLNKIKSVTTQDFKMNKRLWDSRVYETQNKIQIFFISDMGQFCQKRVIKLVRLWVLSETVVTPSLPGNQTIDEYWFEVFYSRKNWESLYDGIMIVLSHKTLSKILSWSDAFQCVQYINT